MNIPKTAKRVFKGKIFEVYQWPQKMFDGTIATFEAVSRDDTVVILATVGNKIVTLKQKQPNHSWFYCEPSGRMDVKGESPKQAALRELLEETGLKPRKIFKWKDVKAPSWKMRQTVHIFIAKDCKKVAEQDLDGGEKIQVNLISFEDWLKLSDNPKYIDGATIQDMLRARLNPKFKKEMKKMLFG